MKNLLFTIGVLAFCFSTSTAQAAELKFDFQWVGWKDKCSGKSPEFKIISVPEGTTRITFKLTDLDVPGWSHGGGAVSYSGKDIPRGALKGSYNGPCPPSGTHKYEWTATAYDKKGGNELGKAKVMKPFPPKK